MNKLLLVGLCVLFLSMNAFALNNFPCDNLHLDVDTQKTLLGGSFGQEICLSALQINSFYLKYDSPRNWVWILHSCIEPKESNNLVRLYTCWRNN